MASFKGVAGYMREMCKGIILSHHEMWLYVLRKRTFGFLGLFCCEEGVSQYEKVQVLERKESEL